MTFDPEAYRRESEEHFRQLEAQDTQGFNQNTQQNIKRPSRIVGALKGAVQDIGDFHRNMMAKKHMQEQMIRGSPKKFKKQKQESKSKNNILNPKINLFDGKGNMKW